MSATLDSDLFSRYFGECPVLTAGGRTFPVQQAFLEDVYELIGYKLDAEGPAALRVDVSERSRRKALEKAAGSKQAIAKVCFLQEVYIIKAGLCNPLLRHAGNLMRLFVPLASVQRGHTAWTAEDSRSAARALPFHISPDLGIWDFHWLPFQDDTMGNCRGILAVR